MVKMSEFNRKLYDDFWEAYKQAYSSKRKEVALKECREQWAQFKKNSDVDGAKRKIEEWMGLFRKKQGTMQMFWAKQQQPKPNIASSSQDAQMDAGGEVSEVTVEELPSSSSSTCSGPSSIQMQSSSSDQSLSSSGAAPLSTDSPVLTETEHSDDVFVLPKKKGRVYTKPAQEKCEKKLAEVNTEISQLASMAQNCLFTVEQKKRLSDLQIWKKDLVKELKRKRDSVKHSKLTREKKEQGLPVAKRQKHVPHLWSFGKKHVEAHTIYGGSGNFDAVFVSTYAPGQSAKNQVERRMAPLSRDLSGLILKHDSFGSHLDSNRRTIDHNLEIRNFCRAGEVLAEVWSDTIIDGEPVVARFVEPNLILPDVDLPSEKWLSVHVRQSQYCLQIVK